MDRVELNRAVITEFRANYGRVGGRYASFTLLLLHSMGARSGKERVNPLGYILDGEDMLVVGSRNGEPRHPDWYWNLKAQPRTVVEVGNQTVPVLATEVTDEDEYARLWAIITGVVPGFLKYQEQTTRRLPILRLAPVR